MLKQIYRDRGDYAKVIDCLIKDQLRRVHVFPFIQSVFMDDVYTEEDRKTVSEELLNNVLTLVDIDSKKTGTILFQFAPERILSVLDRVRNEPGYLEFLTNLLELSETAEPGSPRRSLDEIFTPELYEEYIELLCQHSPSSVLHYIKTKDKYRPDVVMELCNKYRILEGRIYLLESERKYKEAYELLKQQLSTRIQDFLDRTDEEDCELMMAGINTTLLVVIQFCQRVSGNLPEDERDGLWSDLLDTLGAPLQVAENPEPWREMIRHIVSSMLGHVGHKKVVSLVLSNSSCTSGKWSDLKLMLVELIETFRYERQLIESGIQVLEKEKTDRLRRLVRLRTRAVFSTSLSCSVCGTKLSGKVRSVVFACRHGFHVECVDRCGGVVLSEAGEEVWSCVSCTPHPTVKDTTRVTVSGAGRSDKVLDETLTKSIESWRRFHNPAGYTSAQHEENVSFIKSEQFQLKLKPAKIPEPC